MSNTSETSATISINPGLALRLDPIEGGIRVTGSSGTMAIKGTRFDALSKELHAVLAAEVLLFLRAENPSPPKPMFAKGWLQTLLRQNDPLTMSLGLSVQDDTVELICRGATRNGEHLAKGYKGQLSEHERLEAFLEDVCGAYIFEVIYGDRDRYGAEMTAAEIAKKRAAWGFAEGQPVELPHGIDQPPEAALTEAEYRVLDGFRRRLDQMQAQIDELKGAGR